MRRRLPSEPAAASPNRLQQFRPIVPWTLHLLAELAKPSAHHRQPVSTVRQARLPRLQPWRPILRFEDHRPSVTPAVVVLAFVVMMVNVRSTLSSRHMNPSRNPANSICDGVGLTLRPRYVFIARSISAFRASSAVSFFLFSAISLLIARNSVCAFLLNRCSEPSSAAM